MICTLADECFEIKLRIPVARWFGVAAFVSLFVGLISGAVALSQLMALIDDRIPTTREAITRISVEGLIALTAGVACLFALSVFVSRSRVKFDGRNLIITDLFPINTCDIPRHAVRSISVVTRKRRSLRFDPRLPPWRMFFLGPALALDIEVPRGRIRFFKAFEQENLRRVAEKIGHGLGLPVRELEELDPPKADVADAVGTYGKSRSAFVYAGLLVGAAMLVGCSWSVVQGLRSVGWPTVTGEVTHFHYEERRGKSTTYIAEIRYAYRVNERDFSGDDFGYGTGPDDGAVKALLRSHPAGSTISVSYDPRSPGRSVVIPGVALMLWVLVGAAAVTIASVLPWWIAGPRKELDAIVRPYRVLPERGDGAGVELLRWLPPRAAFDSVRRHALRQAMWMWVRIALMSGLAIAGFWIVARRFTPDLPAGLVALIVGALVTLPLLAALYQLARGKVHPVEYRLTDKGIVLPRRDYALLRWELVYRHRVELDEASRCPVLLVFLGKWSEPVRIPLNGDERDNAILAEVQKRGSLRSSRGAV